MKRILAGLLLGVVCLQVSAAEPVWHTDFNKALATAKAEQKAVLINFTGSDWCGFCIKLDKEVFSTTEFADYASKKLVLVKADFPRRTQIPEEQKKSNTELRDKYATPFEGFPTIVVVGADGKKKGQEVGYLPNSGPKAYLKTLDSLLSK